MTTTYLLQADRQQSILSGSNSPMRAYTAYGALPDASGPMLGFAGEVRDRMTGWYHLGNGHRGYNSVLMGFHAPDRLSPFGPSGFNSYSYCLGDPVNHHIAYCALTSFKCGAGAALKLILTSICG